MSHSNEEERPIPEAPSEDLSHQTGSGPKPTATAYRPGTQIDRVLRRLTRGWTCGVTLLEEERLPRASARIHELRLDGWYVERRRCANPSHKHRTAQWEWRIDRMPAEDGQLFGDPL